MVAPYFGVDMLLCCVLIFTPSKTIPKCPLKVLWNGMPRKANREQSRGAKPQVLDRVKNWDGWAAEDRLSVCELFSNRGKLFVIQRWQFNEETNQYVRDQRR